MKPATILAIALFTPALLSADLSKYKDWGASPEAYFMTKTEQGQWSAIKTDADAEQFIKTFEAARKPGFIDEVAKRVQIADKYLTVGKTPGSRTLRGKVIILLGPPTSFDVSKRMAGGEHMMGRDSFVGAGDTSNGQSPSDVVSAVNHADMSAKEVRTFTISYNGDKLPKPRAATLIVVIEVASLTDQETLVEKGQMSDLDALFQAVGGAWLNQK